MDFRSYDEGERVAFPSARLCGIELVSIDPEQASRLILKSAARRDGRGQHVHLVNSYTIASADRDSVYREVFNDSAAVNLPDGKPLAAASKFFSGPNLKQVRGPDLFNQTLASTPPYVRHFLLGSTPQVLSELERRIAAEWPHVNLVGSYSPPFRPLSPAELAELDRKILRSRADLVWVGLGTPKQDFEARRLAHSAGVVTVAVGAAFDFSAGNIQEAPKWMRRLYLEWFYRLCREPRRLWRRYLFGNARFLWLVARSRPLGGRND